MKKVKIEWTETDLLLYSYEEEFEVEDDFEVNTENCLSLAKKWRESDRYFESKSTDYKDADQEIYPVTIDSYVEILPPSPEDRKAEYLELLNEIEKKIAGMVLEKERILKLVNE